MKFIQILIVASFFLIFNSQTISAQNSEYQEPIPPKVPTPQPEPVPIKNPEPSPLPSPFPEETDNEKIQRLTQENNDLRQENTNLKNQITNLQNEKNILTKKIMDLNKIIDDLRQITKEQIKVILDLVTKLKTSMHDTLLNY